MSMVCTEDEISATTTFLDEEKPSTQIAQLVALNFTNEERDQLNLLKSTNNLLGLRDFYLNKYKSLPREQYEMLRKSYNKVLRKFANGSLKEYIAQFLTTLSPKDNAKLMAYGIVSEEDKIATFVNQKLSSENFTDAVKREIELFMRGLFMSYKLD